MITVSYLNASMALGFISFIIWVSYMIGKIAAVREINKMMDNHLKGGY